MSMSKPLQREIKKTCREQGYQAAVELWGERAVCVAVMQPEAESMDKEKDQ